MELDYHLTRKQSTLLEDFRRAMGDNVSWVLRRYQGARMRFWCITIDNGKEWNGTIQRDYNGKTLAQTIELALARWTFNPTTEIVQPAAWEFWTILARTNIRDDSGACIAFYQLALDEIWRSYGYDISYERSLF